MPQGTVDLIWSDLLSVPIFNLLQTFQHMANAYDQIMISFSKALKDLYLKVVEKEATGDPVDPQKVIEGLERIRSRILAFQTMFQKQNAILVSLLHTIALRQDLFMKNRNTFETLEVNTLIGNHLLRQGYFQTLHALCNEAQGVRNLVRDDDIEFFTRNYAIQSQLSHSITDKDFLAPQWCAENSRALKRLNSSFPFHVKIAELCKLKQNTVKAFEFAQKHMSEFVHEKEFQQVLVHLLTGEEMAEQTHMLNQEFIQVRNAVVPLLPVSSFEMLLKLGLSLCKTPSCTPCNNFPNCVACDPCLGKLALAVETSKRSQTNFVCRIQHTTSSRVVVFPQSGQAYSFEAMQSIHEKNGVVTDPQTGEMCLLTDLKRAFLL